MNAKVDLNTKANDGNRCGANLKKFQSSKKKKICVELIFKLRKFFEFY